MAEERITVLEEAIYGQHEHEEDQEEEDPEEEEPEEHPEEAEELAEATEPEEPAVPEGCLFLLHQSRNTRTSLRGCQLTFRSTAGGSTTVAVEATSATEFAKV